jgi:Ca2+-transporting ATPase
LAGDTATGSEVTRNRWIWAALVPCSLLLALPPYWPAIADLLSLVPPTPAMWAIIGGSSLSALAINQTTMIALAALRRRENA